MGRKLCLFQLQRDWLKQSHVRLALIWFKSRITFEKTAQEHL